MKVDVVEPLRVLLLALEVYDSMYVWAMTTIVPMMK